MSKIRIVGTIFVTIVVIGYFVIGYFESNSIEPAENILPEFSKYNGYKNLIFLSRVDGDESDEIILSDEEEMILFSILQNELHLGSGGRFLSTNIYSVRILMNDSKQYIFDIYLESESRIRVFLGNRRFESEALLKWILKNEENF